MTRNISSPRQKLSNFFAIATAILALNFLPRTSAYAQVTETILHSFSAPGDGGAPWAGVIFDSAGNLYGTTSGGGANTNGTVFELSPVSGGYEETILYSFKGKADGGRPFGGLVFDAHGNLYGTGFIGGENSGYPCNPYGCGVVYELSPSTGGGWTESVIHTFHGFPDGFGPVAVLTMDAAGNLYGTTNEGGIVNSRQSIGGGVVFELSPSPSGWKYKILHGFTDGLDGSSPYDGVTFDAVGNIYVAASFGGNLSYCSGAGCGAVIKLSPTSSGPWTTALIHDFTGHADGQWPWGGLLVDSAGNVYGTTQDGGSGGGGTVFEFSPSGSGWTGNILYSFIFQSSGGNLPQGNLIQDASGNLYGTTMQGGGSIGIGGVAFELSPGSGGTWTETPLHNFWGIGDGAYPSDGMIFDSASNLYGTTQGGVDASGVVFELTP
jgi:uncharacterized repeat protein (TIGR03803 family)